MDDARSAAAPGRRSRSQGLPLAVLVFLLVMLALIGGFAPLTMPFGLAAGGVLETGQVEPERWWLAGAVALVAYLLVTSIFRLERRAQIGWLGVLIGGAVLAIVVFGHIASTGQGRSSDRGAPARLRVGMVSALPLFWDQGRDIDGHLKQPGGAMPVPAASRHALRALDHIDASALAGLDRLLIAQPRALAPTELVTLDAWIRKGGRAVMLVDPLLVWPGDLPLGDARRPPLTSLLDPLLTHWGLRLEPVAKEHEGLERRMLASGHVLLMAAASRFTLLPGGEDARCRLTEEGLIALCRVGRGWVRLIADADLIDPRLWLVEGRSPRTTTAYRSDAIAAIDGWLTDPAQGTGQKAPRRIVDDAALIAAMRWAIIVAFVWVGLGWIVQRWLRTE